MAKLKQLADSMEDTAPLAALVNKFGVAKFSDLPDDQLPAFANQLKEQFGV